MKKLFKFTSKAALLIAPVCGALRAETVEDNVCIFLENLAIYSQSQFSEISVYNGDSEFMETSYFPSGIDEPENCYIALADDGNSYKCKWELSNNNQAGEAYQNLLENITTCFPNSTYYHGEVIDQRYAKSYFDQHVDGIESRLYLNWRDTLITLYLHDEIWYNY